MNKYHQYIFNKIRVSNNVILLNGPSVSNLENDISNIKEANNVYWGVNNIDPIEKNILNKINKKIDIFFIESSEEASLKINYMINFLNRNDDNLIITGIGFLNKFFSKLKTNTINNFHKILILEEYVDGSSHICNSLGSMLNILTDILFFNNESPKPIVIFGCDGINLNHKKRKQQNLYYKIDSYDNYLPRRGIKITHFENKKTHKESLYYDMVKFDQESFTFLTRKKFYNNSQIKIYNANIDSNYESIPKISHEDAIKLLIDNSSKNSKYCYNNFLIDREESFFVFRKTVEFLRNNMYFDRINNENRLIIKLIKQCTKHIVGLYVVILIMTFYLILSME